MDIVCLRQWAWPVRVHGSLRQSARPILCKIAHRGRIAIAHRSARRWRLVSNIAHLSLAEPLRCPFAAAFRQAASVVAVRRILRSAKVFAGIISFVFSILLELLQKVYISVRYDNQ
jgi:hypothetical protein